jgi:hypothetical protein
METNPGNATGSEEVEAENAADGAGGTDPDGQAPSEENKQRERLAYLEGLVKTGAMLVGEALLEIQRDRLYRFDHGTFEAFVNARFGFSRSHAYRLIQLAETARAMSPIGDIADLTEAVSRELSRLVGQPGGAEKARQAYRQAQRAAWRAGESKVTAAHVRSVVQGRPLHGNEEKQVIRVLHALRRLRTGTPTTLSDETWERVRLELPDGIRTLRTLLHSAEARGRAGGPQAMPSSHD